jgi:hypothetical protein
VTIHPAIIRCQKCTDSDLPVIVDEIIDMISNDLQHDCQAVHQFLHDCCLTPLSTIFQLYRGGHFLVEETGRPGENNRPVASH